jgi:ABC-type glutathione transport system ATPase component
MVEAGFSRTFPNGAGKTTTIRILNTLLPLQGGAVEVFGHDVRSEPMAVRRLLGYVPQQLSIEAALTGRENVGWFARLFDVPRGERGRRVADALAVMGRPTRPIASPAPTRAAWCGASSLRRRSSTGRRCSCSTSRRSGSTRWPVTASGGGSRRCASRRA